MEIIRYFFLKVIVYIIYGVGSILILLGLISFFTPVILQEITGYLFGENAANYLNFINLYFIEVRIGLEILGILFIALGQFIKMFLDFEKMARKISDNIEEAIALLRAINHIKDATQKPLKKSRQEVKKSDSNASNSKFTKDQLDEIELI